MAKCFLRWRDAVESVYDAESYHRPTLHDVLSELDVIMDRLKLVSDEYDSVVVPFTEQYCCFRDKENHAFYTNNEQDVTMLTLLIDPRLYIKVENDI